jgi:hypothetical protein
MSPYHLQASVALALAIGVVSAAAAPALAQGLPQHMVAYMTGAGQTQCPDNWTEAVYAQGRLILGTTLGSNVQKLAGTPASDGHPPQHVHAFKVTGTVGSALNDIYPSGDNPRAEGGEVTSTGTTDQGGPSALPFIQFLVCERTAAQSLDTAPHGTVAFFNASACPTQWTQYDEGDGRFLLPLLPASADVEPGHATSTVWDPTDPPTHTHGLQASFGTQTAEYELFVENEDDLAVSGNYELSGTSASDGPVLSFVSLLVCENGAGGHSEGVPLGTMIFIGAEDCPDGWSVTIGASGRFVIGIGGNGTQGAILGGDPIESGDNTSTQHDHAFSGKVSLPASAYPGGPTQAGYERGRFVNTADSGYSAASGTATSEVPYKMLKSCTYTADLGPQGAGRSSRQ